MAWASQCTVCVSTISTLLSAPTFSDISVSNPSLFNLGLFFLPAFGQYLLAQILTTGWTDSSTYTDTTIAAAFASTTGVCSASSYLDVHIFLFPHFLDLIGIACHMLFEHWAWRIPVCVDGGYIDSQCCEHKLCVCASLHWANSICQHSLLSHLRWALHGRPQRLLERSQWCSIIVSRFHDAK